MESGQGTGKLVRRASQLLLNALEKQSEGCAVSDLPKLAAHFQRALQPLDLMVPVSVATWRRAVATLGLSDVLDSDQLFHYHVLISHAVTEQHCRSHTDMAASWPGSRPVGQPFLGELLCGLHVLVASASFEARVGYAAEMLGIDTKAGKMSVLDGMEVTRCLFGPSLLVLMAVTEGVEDFSTVPDNMPQGHGFDSESYVQNFRKSFSKLCQAASKQWPADVKAGGLAAGLEECGAFRKWYQKYRIDQALSSDDADEGEQPLRRGVLGRLLGSLGKGSAAAGRTVDVVPLERSALPFKIGFDGTPAVRTMVDVLLVRYWQFGDRQAVVWLTEEGQERNPMTYTEFTERVYGVARLLLAKGVGRQETVVLMYPPGPNFDIALWACMVIGAIAVPVYPVGASRSGVELERFGVLFKSSKARVVLTDTQYRRAVKLMGFARMAKWGGAGGTGQWPVKMEWIVTSEAQSTSPFVMPEVTADNVAYLQFTSGSTGSPAGVVIRHRELLAQIEMQVWNHRASLDPQPDNECMVLWLPQYHDLGLTLALTMLYLAGRCVRMSPMTFLRRPALWIQSLSKYRATVTASPNFGLGYATSKVTQADLEGVTLTSVLNILCGAEPIRFDTYLTFMQRFAAYGLDKRSFVPGYGMAEAVCACYGGVVHEHSPKGEIVRGAGVRWIVVDTGSLEAQGAVITRPWGRRNDADSRLLCGQGRSVRRSVKEETVIRIVDPQTSRTEPGAALPEGTVGEVWVSSATVASGYWCGAGKDKSQFDARVRGEPDSRQYLRTGDIGFLYDGELFICGRWKDTIIIHGRNYYPNDFEATVDSMAHPALRTGCAAAFSLPGTDQVVIAVEARPGTRLSTADGAALCEAVASQIRDAHNCEPHDIVIVAARSLPKTTSGKIRRREATCLYQQRRLSPIVSLLGAASVQEGRSGGGANGDFVAYITDYDKFHREHFVKPRRLEATVSFKGTGTASERYDDVILLAGVGNVKAALDLSVATRDDGTKFLDGTDPRAGLAPVLLNTQFESKVKPRILGHVERILKGGMALSSVLRREVMRWEETNALNIESLVAAVGCECAMGAEPARTAEEQEARVRAVGMVGGGIDTYSARAIVLKNTVSREDLVDGAAKGFAELSGLATKTAAPQGRDKPILVFMSAALKQLETVIPNMVAMLCIEGRPYRAAMEEETRGISEARLAELGFEGRRHTPVMDAFAMECVRLWHPTNKAGARMTKDHTFMTGTRAVKGQMVLANLHWALRDESCFRDPDHFDPARFLPPRSEHNPSGGSDGSPFLGFGPRNWDVSGGEDPLVRHGRGCPARDMIMVILRATLYHWLAGGLDFELASPPSWDISSEYYYPRCRLDIDRITSRRFPRPIIPPSIRCDIWSVAVVGGGVSGMVCAWSLADAGYKVTLIERAARLGGHAAYHEFTGRDGKMHRMNPAFGFFSEFTHPTVWALMKRLRVPVFRGGTINQLNGFVNANGEAEDPRGDPTLAAELERFIADMMAIREDPRADSRTLGAYLCENAYSERFIMRVMPGLVVRYFAGQAVEMYMQYPLRLVAFVTDNVVSNQFQETNVAYYTDNKVYIKAMEECLEARGVRIVTGARASVVRRDRFGGTTVSWRGPGFSEETSTFRRVVFAVQAHQALAVLGGRASAREKEILSQFRHTNDVAVVHDAVEGPFLARDAAERRALQWQIGKKYGPRATLGLTIQVPDFIDKTTPVSSTLAYDNAATTAKVTGGDKLTFEHFVLTPDSLRLRQAVLDMQGHAGVYYAGAWLGGFAIHEDAVKNGLAAAEMIMGAEVFEQRGGLGLELARGSKMMTGWTPFKTSVSAHSASDARLRQLVTELHAARGDAGDEAVLTAVVVNVLSSVTEIDTSPADGAAVDLKNVGMTSVQAVEFFYRIKPLGPDLSFGQLSEPATVGELVNLLVEEGGFSMDSWLAECQNSSTSGAAREAPHELTRETVEGKVRRRPIRRCCSGRMPGWCADMLQTAGLVVMLALVASCGYAGVMVWAHVAVAAGDAWWIAAATAGVLTSQALLLVTLVAGKWLVLGRLTVGTHAVASLAYVRWWWVTRYTRLVVNHLLFPHLRESEALAGMFHRAMGARLGPGFRGGFLSITEHDLVTAGPGLDVHFRARIRPAAVAHQHLVLEAVHLGSDCVVGSASIVPGGATMKTGACTDAVTYIPRGAVLDEYTVWHGSPGRFGATRPRPPTAVSRATHLPVRRRCRVAGVLPAAVLARDVWKVCYEGAVCLLAMAYASTLLAGAYWSVMFYGSEGLHSMRYGPAVFLFSVLAIVAVLWCATGLALRWLLLLTWPDPWSLPWLFYTERKFIVNPFLAHGAQIPIIDQGPLMTALHRLLGSSIGHGTDTVNNIVPDPGALAVGSHSYVSNAIIVNHPPLQPYRKSHRHVVRIGHGAAVGINSAVHAPGLPDGSFLSSLSTITGLIEAGGPGRDGEGKTGRREVVDGNPGAVMRLHAQTHQDSTTSESAGTSSDSGGFEVVDAKKTVPRGRVVPNALVERTASVVGKLPVSMWVPYERARAWANSVLYRILPRFFVFGLTIGLWLFLTTEVSLAFWDLTKFSLTEQSLPLRIGWCRGVWKAGSDGMSACFNDRMASYAEDVILEELWDGGEYVDFILASTTGGVVAATCLVLSIAVIRHLVYIYTPEHGRITHAEGPLAFEAWATGYTLPNLAAVLVDVLSGSRWVHVVYRLYGASIHHTATVHGHIRDHHAVTIGEGATIDEDVLIMGHTFTAAGSQPDDVEHRGCFGLGAPRPAGPTALIISTVSIGAGSSLMQSALLLGGQDVGPHTTMMPLTRAPTVGAGAGGAWIGSPGHPYE